MSDVAGRSDWLLSQGGVRSDPPSDLVEIARVAGAHGVRGWIKILPFSSDSTVLDSVKRWWISAPEKTLDRELGKPSARMQPVQVVWARPHGATWLASLKGLTDRDDAQAMKGFSIWVSRGDFPAPADDEFYWVDLIGCEVVMIDGAQSNRIGIVDSVQESPAHPLLSVLRQNQDASGNWHAVLSAKGKPVYTLIPFVAAHVPAVDIECRRITVDWPADF